MWMDYVKVYLLLYQLKCISIYKCTCNPSCTCLDTETLNHIYTNLAQVYQDFFTPVIIYNTNLTNSTHNTCTYNSNNSYNTVATYNTDMTYKFTVLDIT